MRTFVIVEADPSSKLSFDVGFRKVDGGPELFEIGPLTSLDLAVQVGRAGADRTEADALAHEALLHLVGEEFSTAIGLNALYRERHAANDAVEEDERACRRFVRSEAEHAVTGAVIYGGVLI